MIFLTHRWMLQSPTDGGYSSVAERRSVAADVVGSKPTSRPNLLLGTLLSRFVEALKGTAEGSVQKAIRVPRSPKSIAVAPHTAPAPRNLFVGTSGWAYSSWKPGFYPQDVPARGFLHFYASQLNAVEVNYTFRTLPTAAQLTGWLGATPPGFRFSFKAPQRITHFARLRDCGAALEQFLTCLEPVREAGRLGPLLFQLPPNLAPDLPRLRAFLAESSLRQVGAPRLAFEFRHAGWFGEETYAVLRDAGAALCVAETDDLDTPDIVTAPFRCYRLRRDGGYTPAELDRFAQNLMRTAADGEVYAFFRHQPEPTGALNARALLRKALSLAGDPRAEHEAA